MEPLATEEESPRVRLYLAVALQRLILEDRWLLASRLVQRSEDAADHNIPLMIWYGIEPLIDLNPTRFAQLASDAKLPVVQEHAARRMASHNRSEVSEAACNRLFETFAILRAEAQLSILRGLLIGFEGRREIHAPVSWKPCFDQVKTLANEQVFEQAVRLGVAFNDPSAIEAMIGIMDDSTQTAARRVSAIRSLLGKKHTRLRESLLRLIGKNELRAFAIECLAKFDDPNTADYLLGLFPQFDEPSRQAVVRTLSSRAAWSRKLLDALETGLLSPRDVSAYDARQMLDLGDSEIDKRLRSLWGDVRPTTNTKLKQMASLKKKLSDETLGKSDSILGKTVFTKSCHQCHRLFGEGGSIGPDLTGAQRTNLDYLLENIVDPSASVAKDFMTEKFLLEGGRVVTGIVLDESEFAITVQTATERLVLPKPEVEQRQPSKLSIMPEGLLENLSEEQICGLFSYLMERGGGKPGGLGQ